jgi:hypothetical protein
MVFWKARVPLKILDDVRSITETEISKIFRPTEEGFVRRGTGRKHLRFPSVESSTPTRAVPGLSFAG